MIAPAALDETGKAVDFSMTAEQMQVTYADAAKILAEFGATLNNVVERTLYVLDVDEAFAVAGKVRKEAYAKARPQYASNLIGVSRLALPEQLVEIAFSAIILCFGSIRVPVTLKTWARFLDPVARGGACHGRRTTIGACAFDLPSTSSRCRPLSPIAAECDAVAACRGAIPPRYENYTYRAIGKFRPALRSMITTVADFVE